MEDPRLNWFRQDEWDDSESGSSVTCRQVPHGPFSVLSISYIFVLELKILDSKTMFLT